MHRTIRWLALGAAVFLLSACSGNKNAPLAYVPANTPYVVANLEPITDDAYAGLVPASTSTTQVAARMSRARRMADQLEQSNKPRLANLLRAIVDLTPGQTYAQMEAHTGIDRHGLFALYGLGLSPVLRGQLSDPAKFNAYVGKLEKAYGKPFATDTLDGRSYQHIALDDSGLELLVATHEMQFVVALLPAKPATAQLRLVLGLDHPEQSLQDAGRLSKLADAEGYGPYLVSYLDTTKLPALLAGFNDPLLQAVIHAAAANGGDRAKVSKGLPTACEPGLMRIAARVPLISFGFTRLNRKERAQQLDIRLAPDIVKAFQGTGTEVPGLGTASNAPLDFALALPVPAIRKFWLAQAEAVAAKPFICPALAGLNKMFASMQKGLPRTAMPPFGDLRGFRLVLDQIDISGMASGTDQVPKQLQARLLVASHDPAGLWDLAKATIPDLADLTLKADGQPVALPSKLTAKAGQPAWLAMSDTAIAIGVGPGEKDKLASTLDANTAPAGTLMHVHVTGAFYLHWLQELDQEMSRWQATGKHAAGGNNADASFHARMEAAIAAAKYLKDGTSDATLTDQGLRVRSDQHWK